MRHGVFRLGGLSAALSLLAAGVPSAAANEEALVLTPSSSWVLNFADESCTLTRLFGQGDHEVRFQLVSYGSPFAFTLVVTGRDIPDFGANMGRLRVAMNPDTQERQEVGVVYGKVDRLHAASLHFAFTPADPAEANGPSSDTPFVSTWQAAANFAPFERAVRDVRLEFESGETVEFKVGDMTKALETMRTCVATLYKFWKLDPEQQKSIVRTPSPTRSPVGRMSKTYPGGMLWSGTGAYVPVRVIVNPSGKALECVVQQEAVESAFQEHVCETLTRLKYNPAIDSAGKPVTGVFQTAVVYTAGR